MTGTELDSSKMKGMSMKAGLNRWDSWRKCAQVSFKSWEKISLGLGGRRGRREEGNIWKRNTITEGKKVATSLVYP